MGGLVIKFDCIPSTTRQQGLASKLTYADDVCVGGRQWNDQRPVVAKTRPTIAAGLCLVAWVKARAIAMNAGWMNKKPGAINPDRRTR